MSEEILFFAENQDQVLYVLTMGNGDFILVDEDQLDLLVFSKNNFVEFKPTGNVINRAFILTVAIM